MHTQLTTTQWLQLPMSVRMELKKIFNIPRSQGTLVEDNRVVSDGYTHPDLAHITIEQMQAFTGSTSDDFFNLFNEVLVLIENAQPEVPSQPQASEIKVETVEELFIEHNGKTYKLVEVQKAPEQPLVPTIPQVPGNTLQAPKVNKGGRPKGSKSKTK